MPPPIAAVLSTSEETEQQWTMLHREFALRLAETARVREEQGEMLPRQVLDVDERLVQAIWNDQMIRGAELTTASGKAVEIIEPGRWNTGRGPDFLDARIRLAGEVLEGHIEIHVDNAEWQRHGHHKDFEYNPVVLHVSLRAADDRPYDERQNGTRLERLVLGQFLDPDLDTIRATINLSDYPYGKPDDLGFCHEQFLKLPEDQLHEFLLVAGRSRMEHKIARFKAQRGTADFLQVIYQALMTGQGFKSSKTLYVLLSKRAPIHELMDHAADFPAERRTETYFSALLHVARLVPEQSDFLTEADDETRAFFSGLEEAWRPLRPYFSDRFMPPTKRWFAGMRPAGFPTRRLAAVAVLLSRLTDQKAPLFEAFCARIMEARIFGAKPREISAYWKSLAELFAVEGTEHYFGSHFSFGGKKQPPQALLGIPAAQSLIFNVFLPLAILRARETKNKALETQAWELVIHHPNLEKNSVVRFMARRIFGESTQTAGLMKREIFQQSLLKIFNDCCAQNERTCNDCTFFAAAEKLHGKAAAG